MKRNVFFKFATYHPIKQKKTVMLHKKVDQSKVVTSSTLDIYLEKSEKNKNAVENRLLSNNESEDVELFIKEHLDIDGVSDGDEDMEIGVNNDEGMDVSSCEDKGVEVVENEDKDEDVEGGDAHKSNETEDMDICNNDKECLCRIYLLHDPLFDTFWVQCICNR